MIKKGPFSYCRVEEREAGSVLWALRAGEGVKGGREFRDAVHLAGVGWGQRGRAHWTWGAERMILHRTEGRWPSSRTCSDSLNFMRVNPIYQMQPVREILFRQLTFVELSCGRCWTR